MLLGVDGNPVKMLLEFVPEKADGEIKIDIPFNTSNLNKMEVVVFEDLYNSYDMLVGCHNDLEDTAKPDDSNTPKNIRSYISIF